MENHNKGKMMTPETYERIKPIHNHLQYNVQALCYLGLGYYLGRKYQQVLPFTLAGGVTATMIYQARKKKFVCVQLKIYMIVAKCIAAAAIFYQCKKRVGGDYFWKVISQGCGESGIAVVLSIIDLIFFSRFTIPYLKQKVDLNDINAQFKLGKFYYQDSCCLGPIQQDLEKSCQYFELAAKNSSNGDNNEKARANFIAGKRYFDGDGVEVDWAKAKEYWEKGRDLGHEQCKIKLAEMN